jgi:alpha-D-xyloside xylohydrolase
MRAGGRDSSAVLKTPRSDRDGVEALERTVMVASEIESTIGVDGDALVRRCGHETMRVEPWGRNSVRVRVSLGSLDDGPGALLERPAEGGTATDGEEGGSLVVGDLTVELDSDGRLRFSRSADGAELLVEQRMHDWWPGSRNFITAANGYYRIEQQFRAYDDERLYGLGQHQHGRLDQKGIVLDLAQRNAEVSIPFLVSSRGYGLLWNNPAVGRVELGETGTRWVADSARQIDYWITVGSPAEIAEQYAAATGHAPMLPGWAAGFWQSKLRYRTQEELLAVAREYKERELPLSVIVSDFFHWPQLGEWRLEPSEWPDPEAMVGELAEMGVKLMVSVWPSVSTLSSTYGEMLGQGLFLASEYGTPFHTEFPDRGSPVAVPVSFYDSTNPAAREYLWEQLHENYYKLGIRVFWLDACEPELRPSHPQSLRLNAGPGSSVINRYPLDHARTVHDGMRSVGDDEIVTLCRSAWAGSQRYGAAVWSGDIGATFEALRAQIRCGLNIGLSGIPWWTSDIGGFHGGDPDDPDYRELVIRWFQYGVWCPLFRLHGHREPRTPLSTEISGGPNEVWSFGDKAYGVISKLLLLRERMTPYILEQMRHAAESGTPPMRPLWFDDPADEIAWTIEDEFMFGPDVLVAPIGELGERKRMVYLPSRCDWRHAVLGTTLPGGEWHEAEAPLEWIPVFVREGSGIEFGQLLAGA